MVRLRQLLAGLGAIALQEGDEVAVVGDALAQVDRGDDVAVAHAAVLFEEGAPPGRADPFGRLVAVHPLRLADLALQQHDLDLKMHFAIGDLGIHPGVALEQIHLLIHLLVEPRHDRPARLRQGLGQRGFVAELRGQGRRQARIQTQARHHQAPGDLVELLVGLPLALHDLQDAFGLVAHPFLERRLGRGLAGERLVAEEFRSVNHLLRKGILALGQFRQRLLAQDPDFGLAARAFLEPQADGAGEVVGQLALPIFGAEDRPADDHLQPLADRLRDVAHRGDEQPAFDRGERGHIGIHLAPVPTDQHRIVGIEPKDDLEMVGVGPQVGRRRGRAPNLGLQPDTAQALALAGAEPEPPLAHLLEQIVKSRPILAAFQNRVVDHHAEVERRIAKDRFHLVVGVCLGGPAVFIQLQPHAQIEKVILGIAGILQPAIHARDQAIGQRIAVETLPGAVQQADIATIA